MTPYLPRCTARALTTGAALSFWFLTGTAFAQFSGTFKGDGLTLTLKPVPGQANRYNGTVSLNGQNFPAKGVFSGQKFSGTFQASGQSFPFTLRRSANGLTLSSSNTNYNLRPQGGGTNPLARGPQNPLAQNPLTRPGGRGMPDEFGGGAPAGVTGGMAMGGAMRPDPNDRSGYLGLTAMLDDDNRMCVFSTSDGGPAERAGLKRGDIIRSAGGRPITNDDQMVALMRGPVGSRVPLAITRLVPNGKPQQLNVTLVRTPMPGAQGRGGGQSGSFGGGMGGPENMGGIGGGMPGGYGDYGNFGGMPGGMNGAPGGGFGGGYGGGTPGPGGMGEDEGATPNGAANANAGGGYLGIGTMMDDTNQMRVFMVVEGGPAQLAGLQSGDIIRAVGGTPVTSDAQMRTLMRGPVGSRVPMLVARPTPDGNVRQFNVTVVRGTMPTPNGPNGGGAPNYQGRNTRGTHGPLAQRPLTVQRFALAKKNPR